MNTPFEKIPAKKSLGQHFLTNPHIPESVTEAAHVCAGDTVLEVGPGTGVLTRTLLNRGAHVIALEADARAVAALQSTFASEITSGKLALSHTDVRSLELSSLNITEHQYKVVANIPYYLSGMLFRTYLQSHTQPSDLVFLVQKEVAVRIARSTKESILSLSVKVYGDPTYVQTVGKGNFTPQPKVDSAIIAISNISHERFTTTGLDETFFFKLLHLGMGAKRKQLLGNLAQQFDRASLINIFSTLDIDPATRGEDVTAETWLLLATALQNSS